MLQEALGQKLPDNLKIVVHEEDLRTLHFSMPPTRESLGKELTDEQLEQIAGGTELAIVATFLGIGAILSASVAGTIAGIGTVAGAVVAKTVKW
jgi:bacteriocin-like protein